MINLQPLNSKEYLIIEIQKIFIMEKIKKETMKDVYKCLSLSSFLIYEFSEANWFAIAFYWCSEMQALRESEFTLKSIYQNCEEM